MPRNIVVCCDGTGNEYGRHNTNVVKLYEALVRDARQIAFYDPGVGTFSFLGIPLGRRIGLLLGQAFGAGLQQNVEDAYRYLMDQYRPGDKVFFFGFSRGAFTVRALAGMLNLCGLLERGSVNLVPYVSRIYNNSDQHDVAPGFRQAYCRECRPYFIGVWDTVGSMGWFWGRKFFDATLHHDITYGYHAVSVDECQKKFPVSLWNEAATAADQTIEQVWFSGVHSDVGGSYAEAGLSDIVLQWMLEKAENHDLRLKQNWRDALAPDPSGVLHNSRIRLWRLWRPAPRLIPPGSKVHASVQARMRDLELRYRPSNLPTDHTVVD